MRFIALDQVDSTNLEVRRRILNRSAQSGLWVRADVQTDGRGRRGRAWTSRSGNLFCTGAYVLDMDARTSAQLSFVAALAVVDMVDQLPLTSVAALKWPNDVLIGDRKVAGILLERVEYDGQAWMLVGVGVNLVTHPNNTEYPATHVWENITPAALDHAEPPTIGPDESLAVLASGFEHWTARLKDEGFAPIREAWLARAYNVPGDVRVRLPQEEFKGVAMGLGPQGELQVKVAGGTVRDVHAGDVFFR